MSEFGITRQEFFFHYTLPQLFLLITSRTERNKSSEQEEKEPKHSSLQELEMLASQFSPAF